MPFCFDRLLLALILAVSFCRISAQAEVNASSDCGFQLSASRTTDASPEIAYKALLQVDQWWNPEHTYTLDASNLAMDLDRRCFCERLPKEGFVRHMEIVYHSPGSMLRLIGGLGPLQELGIHGALTVKLKKAGKKTIIEWTYNASGYLPGGMKPLAPVVDRVQVEQLERLIKYCDTLE